MKQLILTVIIAFFFLVLGIISCNSSGDNSSKSGDTTNAHPRSSDSTMSVDSPKNNLDSANRSH